MVDLWLLVPVKPFGEGKSRLARQLTQAERAALSRRLLERLLTAAIEAQVFAGIVVVSRDPDVWALAAAHGVAVLPEEGTQLNSALDEARSFAQARGAQALAVLPADLPCVTAQDLRLLVAHMPDAPGALLVPSETGGTNALLLCPVDALPFAFGPESFERHRALAHERGITLAIVRSAALAFDVDLPADLDHPALAQLA